jgi:crotonobetainyl-CoA:carnitine CoA-transferase CaiB-like acyl-CoA transferase
VARLPTLPIEMDHHRFGVHIDVPGAGGQSDEILNGLGYPPEDIDALRSSGILA